MTTFRVDRRVPLLLTEGFFDPAVCEQIQAAMDRGQSDPAEVIDETITRRDAVRRTRSIEVDDQVLASVEERFDGLRSALMAAFGRTLGEREGTAFLRYEAGGFYKPHRDRGSAPGWPAAARREIAVVLFLNDGIKGAHSGDFAGGELVLYPDGHAEVAITPRRGLLAAFPATLLHEVRVVRVGTRDTVVDWFYDSSSDRA